MCFFFYFVEIWALTLNLMCFHYTKCRWKWAKAAKHQTITAKKKNKFNSPTTPKSTCKKCLYVRDIRQIYITFIGTSRLCAFSPLQSFTRRILSNFSGTLVCMRWVCARERETKREREWECYFAECILYRRMKTHVLSCSLAECHGLGAR